ncbi:MAG: hypothetical protein VCA73_08015 [Roseibacillus sp.]
MIICCAAFAIVRKAHHRQADALAHEELHAPQLVARAGDRDRLIDGVDPIISNCRTTAVPKKV